jgi:hypothetical protein
VGYAFHQAAVAEENIGAVINDAVAVTIEAVSEHALGDGHANGVGEALTKRTAVSAGVVLVALVLFRALLPWMLLALADGT